MQINVSVDGLDGIDLTTVVGDEIAWYNPETDEREYRPRTLGDLVAERLVEKLHGGMPGDMRNAAYKQSAAIRAQIIREKVEPMITQVLAGEIRKTNNYGEPTGQVCTLTELILDETQKVLNKRQDSFGGRGNITLIQSIVKDAVGATFAKELREAIDAEKTKVVAAVRARGAELLTEAVKQGLGVR